MDFTAAATVGGLVGLALGVLAFAAVRLSDRERRRGIVAAPAALEPGMAEVLGLLKAGTIVLDSDDAVRWSTPSAIAHGLVRGESLAHQELLSLARRVRRDGVIREDEFDLRRGPIGVGTLVVGVRAAPLSSNHVLILIEDRSTARRIDETRRDFVANVSHELKTPVGGIALLAEAILDAYDDPEAVERFAMRIQKESNRLTRLVQEIIDLSRLEMATTLSDPVLIDVGEAAHEAIERSHLDAEASDITLIRVSEPGSCIYGDRELLITAIRNLIGNAIAYSDAQTCVTVKVRKVDGFVELSVNDEGRGITPADQERIFERFYRVDTARSRATGGTGLGLAIVKHVCANHGGDVTVVSDLGVGSTFTIRIPAAATPYADLADGGDSDGALAALSPTLTWPPTNGLRPAAARPARTRPIATLAGSPGQQRP